MEFRLRSITANDIGDFAAHANNLKIARNMTDRFPHPYTPEDGKRFLEFIDSDNGSFVLGIDIEGKIAGAIGLHAQPDVHHRNMELGYWIAEEYWGRGIVSEAVMQMVSMGFERFDIDRIFARPYGSNKGSQRVLEKCGFVLEASLEKTILKFGEYEDELIYAIRIPQ